MSHCFLKIPFGFSAPAFEQKLIQSGKDTSIQADLPEPFYAFPMEKVYWT